MKNGVIGADHEFHNKEFAAGWAERFVPSPERLRLFNTILYELQEIIPENGYIVELGIGPGYLAQYILEAMPQITYRGIDFSEPMLELARSRLKLSSSRVTYTRADLVTDEWEGIVPTPVDAIVSTWSLHDLGSPQNVETVYTRSFTALSDNGILLNGDFVKPDQTRLEFEGGRFTVVKHLEILRQAGFSDVDCRARFEEEIVSPTPAQNYACIRALK